MPLHDELTTPLQITLNANDIYQTNDLTANTTVIHSTLPDQLYNYMNDLDLTNNYTIGLNTEYKILMQKDLDDILGKIYKIIADHTAIDISEEEFMKLIKDDK